LTVRELLATHTSAELTELRAYERKNGPIGAQYMEEALAAIHEQIQRVVSAIVAGNVKDEDDIPEVVHFPRPYEVFNLKEE
jgi:hypothetical protein